MRVISSISLINAQRLLLAHCWNLFKLLDAVSFSGEISMWVHVGCCCASNCTNCNVEQKSEPYPECARSLHYSHIPSHLKSSFHLFVLHTHTIHSDPFT